MWPLKSVLNQPSERLISQEIKHLVTKFDSELNQIIFYPKQKAIGHFRIQ